MTAPADLLDRARHHLDIHSRALASLGGDDRASVARLVHQDLADLLPVLQELLEDREQLAAKLHTARRDPVTGLATRAGWTEFAERLVAEGPTTVFLCDLDEFKAVNDTYGHAAGDAVLAATAQRLAGWCGPRGGAGRLGGDEFVVAVPYTGEDLDGRVAELRQILAQPVEYRGRLLPIGASVGAAKTVTAEKHALSGILGKADAAMYRAKGRGRRGRRPSLPRRITLALRELLRLAA
ncbi:GGDEF domain-containing protein [Kitasatospora kifunensis]|uniref:Diguanylate cyclase (GGDEF)-like protein n=1 Tax=Kitasatospora kifunensis TaxID=58351 RepID=A0A7W7RCP0_KITKI|nr:GGDEF domain-containing protein [Kitasatospora kifunensis]MBB4929168.1 diguanylate cyclase (GGDEF)-like protein [Kitasatospora kifunensis]